MSAQNPPSKFIDVCKFSLPIFICINSWSVKLNWSDQVPALCTAWRKWMWRGSWAWRCDWSTAGASAERAVKCAAGIERGVCRSLSNLAQLCFSALSEPFCLCWMSNAARTHVPFPPNTRCAGWGWGRSTLGCSPPFNMLLLCVGEAPLLVKQWAGHILAYKRWLQWVFICAKVGIASDAVTGWETWGHRGDSLKHVYLISSNAFDLFLNDWPPERVFHDTDPIQLLRSNYNLPMDSVMGNSIGGVNKLHLTWTWIF